MSTRAPAEWGLPDLAGRLALGASPRAPLGLLAAARAHALPHGRGFVVPGVLFDVAPEVLRDGLLLPSAALAVQLRVDDVTGRVLSTVPPPRIAPHQDP